jgi:hypothetical protein
MKSIVLCASLSAYKHLMAVKLQLEKLGFLVLVQPLADKMAQTGKFHPPPETLAEKSQAMRDHLDKIAQAQAILVINDDKNGFKGYIGAGVLIEMGLAFYLYKPIYLLNPPDSKLPSLVEIKALNPTVINGNLSLIPLS